MGSERKVISGFGIGLRAPHLTYVLEKKPAIDWFEVITENLFGLDLKPEGVVPRTILKIREHYPIALHGVSLSIGSTDPLSLKYLRALEETVKKFQPLWISDHLCWTGVKGENIHDLLPIPYTQKALRFVSARVQKVQDRLQRPLVLENVSSYVSYPASEMTEGDFLRELSVRTGCGLLVDLNNIFVSCRNHGWDTNAYLNALPPDSIVEYHLAGHQNHGDYLLDSHDEPVCPEVWNLYGQALKRWGARSTLLEWDEKIPPLEVLQRELQKAKHIYEGRSKKSAGVDAMDRNRSPRRKSRARETTSKTL